MVFHLFTTLRGGYNSGKKRDLSIISPDLPTVLQTSPGTKGMPKNLSSPEKCTDISHIWLSVKENNISYLLQCALLMLI